MFTRITYDRETKNAILAWRKIEDFCYDASVILFLRRKDGTNKMLVYVRDNIRISRSKLDYVAKVDPWDKAWNSTQNVLWRFESTYVVTTDKHILNPVKRREHFRVPDYRSSFSLGFLVDTGYNKKHIRYRNGGKRSVFNSLNPDARF